MSEYKLDKETLDMIEREAEEKYPFGSRASLESCASKEREAYKSGYLSCHSKLLKECEEKDKRIAELEKQHEELLPLYQLQTNVIYQRNKRIKELEDLISKSIIYFERVERFDLVEQAKQLLTKNS